MEGYDKNKESSNIGWAILQKLPVNIYEWIKNTSDFNKYFTIKTMIKKAIKGIFWKLMFNILKSYMSVIEIYHFYPKDRKFKKLKNLKISYIIKLNIYSH